MPFGITIPRKYKTTPNTGTSTKSYTPHESSRRPHHLSNPARDRPLVFLANGRTLSQSVGLQPVPGQVGFAGDRPQDGIERPSPLDRVEEDLIEDHTTEPLMYMNDSNGGLESMPPPTENLKTRHRRHRENQTRRWLNEVLPKLIVPYMKLVCHTDSFHLASGLDTDFSCSCGGVESRQFSVIVIRFYDIQSLQVVACKCCPAARQLVLRGLFPSTPLSPSLAVDIRVLDFVSRLFLNVAPNTTAWCKTVEDFLGSQGYKLATKGSLRKRFGESLRWFTMLQAHTDQHVKDVLNIARSLTTGLDDGKPETFIAGPSINPQQPLVPQAESVVPAPLGAPPPGNGTQSRKRNRDEGASTPRNPFPEPLPRSRPSDYLRSRCPLCFGGKFPRPRGSKGPDAIVCVDACFKQKRNKGEKDPANTHPESLFLSQKSIQDMENYIEFICLSQNSSKKPKPPKRSHKNEGPEDDEVDDGYDGPLRVPRSVLATCQESFTAADESRQKASTQFFLETALMALLCRHDRVLWIVSMTSAGEKQHYTFALIETLFQHLPTTFTVGLLYDIGCQLNQSCVKWGFLGRYLERLMFAVSVFHAFGHQWACQIIYHPRKCVGFGLSDGEGCERLWKSIQHLIPYLRVCGHYSRLFTIDRQLLSAEKDSREKISEWLQRRTRHCHQKQEEAERGILESGVSIEALRTHWSDQVSFQTRPLPRQSKNKGKEAVERALQLRKSRDMIKHQLREAQDLIADDLSEDYIIADAELRLPELHARLERIKVQVQLAERALGVDDRAKLKGMINNPYISARMNARALKMRLREKLRSRKFELDRLERSFRHQVNERKIDEHTESSVQRRDPGIQKLAREYNKLCRIMYNLKAQGKAPPGSICPEEIELSGIFALDVDDDIWQDIGLDDSLDESTSSSQPPLWLCDDKVRSGIKAMLEYDRCAEEKERLAWECVTLQEWYQEEWDTIGSAIEATDFPELKYQLNLRKTELIFLLVIWQKSLQSIPTMGFDNSLWGPTHDEILQVRIANITSSTTRQGTGTAAEGGQACQSDDEILSLGDEDEFADGVLLDTLEGIDLADSFRHEHFD